MLPSTDNVLSKGRPGTLLVQGDRGVWMGENCITHVTNITGHRGVKGWKLSHMWQILQDIEVWMGENCITRVTNITGQRGVKGWKLYHMCDKYYRTEGCEWGKTLSNVTNIIGHRGVNGWKLSDMWQILQDRGVWMGKNCITHVTIIAGQRMGYTLSHRGQI